MRKSDTKTPRGIESSSHVEEVEEREPNPPTILLSSDSDDVKKIKKTKDITGTENDVEKGKRKEDCDKLKETDAFLEIDPEEKSDNSVLRKLLRGPRYFDPPDGSWGNCYNCGESGHTIANCAAAKRKKPCFVCGSLEHNAKQCKQGKDCFICKKGGHRAKDCPEKSKDGFQKAKLCLKCGDSGHDMFTCRTVYSPDALKELQCYICKCFGHLCCVNYATGARELSCYRCGQLGHTGLKCTSASVSAEIGNAASHSYCYKCGEEGHKARKCASSAKKRKRKTGFSRPKQSHLNNNRDHIGVKSAPHDLGEARKRNKIQHGQPTPLVLNRRGGWITEGRGGYYHGPFNANNWGSPSTPASYRSKNIFHGNHGASRYGSGLQYEPSGSNGGARGHGLGFQYGASGSNGGASGHGLGFNYGPSGSNVGASGYDSGFQYEASGSNGYRHRFSASRFGNSSNYGRREYGWDY
ncbi:DNA-binding protein HEXBP-like isoform X2 [Cynara cardunculus var. scolymus]|uniref:DNA-binding protein HEXBP-like isoform X2 n=1 Tax=Cynara cardunculus var. scolymus TaxID=59895 RepID=UPI000D62B5CF|nr:DNA-binding protein HEXBP-like isoform X2 [Cynara cardunculus var. scolymus]